MRFQCGLAEFDFVFSRAVDLVDGGEGDEGGQGEAVEHVVPDEAFTFEVVDVEAAEG